MKQRTIYDHLVKKLLGPSHYKLCLIHPQGLFWAIDIDVQDSCYRIRDSKTISITVLEIKAPEREVPKSFLVCPNN